MYTFEIEKNYRCIESDFNIKRIDNLELFIENCNDIVYLIDCFNSEYNWDCMFNIEDVEERVKNEEILFLLYYKSYPAGYVFFKELEKNICFGYNLYVTKKIKKPNHSAYWFYNNVTEIILNEYDKIKVQVEEWNYAIIDIIKNIGYYKINK